MCRRLKNFVLIIQQTLDEIQKQPEQFRKSYKHFHEIKARNYPFSIIYFIDESKQVIIITTLFHQKRNPDKKFNS